ncbi:MAG: NAD-dependent epimerase/dehydratase family protein [Bacteroidales bacterium]|nr:NAD-dependent epimerase/dehydratase family protein [Bacteroidales bacterium]
MVKILVTGKNSFVGKNFIKQSKYDQIDEISLIENKPEEINFSDYDVVLHLVAIVHQSKQIEEKEYFRVNRDLCLRTAQEAKKAGVKQFVFLSTVKVYGSYNPEIGTWNESSICEPDDSYGKSKFAAEKELEKLVDKDFTVSIVRTPLVYGEDVKANMLSLINLVEKFPILPLGNSNNRRSFTSVQNLVAFIDRIIEKRLSGVFIAKDNRDLSTTELVTYISKFLKKKLFLLSIPRFIIYFGKRIYPKIFDRLYGSLEFENKETLERLDFSPPLSIDEGLRKMIKAYQKNK